MADQLSQQDIQDLMQVRSMLPQGDQRIDKIDRLIMMQGPPPQVNASVPVPLGLQKQAKPEVGKPVTQQSGEGFADFMQRVKEAGSQVTQEDINKEGPEMKQKAAITLGAAPLIGFGGAATLAAPGEIKPAYDAVIKALAGNVLPGMESEAAKQTILRLAPKVLQFAKDAGIGAGGIGLLWKAIAAGNSAKK